MAAGGVNQRMLERISDIGSVLPNKLAGTKQQQETKPEPICGFDKLPLVTLEEAVKPLISILPNIYDDVAKARENSSGLRHDGLTEDELASILLYTMEPVVPGNSLYSALNATLRSGDRQKLTPWFSYLKLLITALKRLPSVHQVVFRGVNRDLTDEYPAGRHVIWWSFSSCTTTMNVLQKSGFLPPDGERTMFTIHCNAGKDISHYSDYRDEAEVLLLPGRQFMVESCLKPAPGLIMIQLRETKSDIELLEGDASTVLLMIYQESIPVLIKEVILQNGFFPLKHISKTSISLVTYSDAINSKISASIEYMRKEMT